MLLKVFAVYDSKLGAFFNPFFVAHPVLAKRSFTAVCNDKGSQISQHPQDFTLFEIAEYNDENGTFDSYAKHINHGSAALYKVRGDGNGEDAQEQVGHEAHVQRGAEGRNPS